nr:MAG TPA: DNA polymerase III, alpha subunit [Caudoviricetes sp.]
MDRFEVHAHTDYSNIRLIDCINKVDTLISRAQEIGLRGICITDHECLSGHVKANQIALGLQKKGSDFKIGLGNEIYLTDSRESNQRYWHFILIAKDVIGYKQLRILSSRAWLQSYHDRGMERVPTLKSELAEIVKANKGHLIATSACLGGELSAAVLEMEEARHRGDKETAAQSYHRIKDFLSFVQDLFGDDFYIECAPGASKEQVIVNKKLAEIANVYGMKMVIGTDAHYLKKEDRYVHKAYLNSKNGEREVDNFYEFSYLQTEEEIVENLTPSIVDSYEKMCANSMEIFDKIQNYSLLHNQVIPQVEVKDFPQTKAEIKDCPILNAMYASENQHERYWVNECVNKLKELGKYNETYLKRLEEEADVKKTIGEKLGTNMFSYPITLQHYTDLFWECGSLVGAGRGSSCSGLNHYLLGVTQVDPIEWRLPFWRYLNKDRAELGDIDIDICPSKKGAILQKIKEERGAKFLESIDSLSRENLGAVLVATFGTEGTRSTILTACRGYRSEDCPDGIDVDEAQYIASLIPQERGFSWSLSDVMYGNKEKNRKKSDLFIKKMEEYPGLFDIMNGIVGLINKRSSHASGVIFMDEDPYQFGAFMRTPRGEVITACDLHDAEAQGMTKYDMLVTEVQDKIAQTILFLQENGEIEKDLTLRQVYDKYFSPDVLPLGDEATWKNIQAGKILNIFQFDSDVGSQAIKKIQPTTITEMSDANSLMRLMAAEPGAETPLDKYVRFKNNIKLWYQEMKNAGLTQKEMETLEPYFKESYGVPPSQEQLMMMLMDEGICGFSLKEANAARKLVGKKLMDKIPELKKQIKEMAKSPAIAKYVWECGVKPQLGYSFSKIHSSVYSLIGFQTAYLATRWNPIYWNTACLVVNSGSLEDAESATTDYAKLAKALGEIIEQKIKVSLVDINKSDYGFLPDVKNNQIIFGLKALSGVNAEVIEKIIQNRPYLSLKDFIQKCALGKTAMVSLIKGGAFDFLMEQEKVSIHPRLAAMIYYLSINCNAKSKLTLQNLNGLIEEGLLPTELDFERRVFRFNKYLKGKKSAEYYALDNPSQNFYREFFDEELLKVGHHGDVGILQKDWDKIYSSIMDKVRAHLVNHQQEMLSAYNQRLFKAVWDKYAKGSISAWEMEALCFYYHEHELAHADMQRYGAIDFRTLSREPIVERTFKKGNREIPLFKLNRIIGTVISKNDARNSIFLLTTGGVVSVKFTKEYYAMFGRQLSEVQEDGTKKVVEKGWFKRGEKLMITGFRREDTFVAKKYQSTGGHQLYKIISVEPNGELVLTHERKDEE